MINFWQRLSKRERSLALVTALILLGFVAKLAIVTPFFDRREWVKQQLESQPQLLAKNRRYLAQKETMLAALEAARAEIKAQEPKLLTGDTPSVSASDLQETVQALATREGTQVITTRVLNPDAAGSFSKIAIQLEIGGQIQQVASLIKALESDFPSRQGCRSYRRKICGLALQWQVTPELKPRLPQKSRDSVIRPIRRPKKALDLTPGFSCVFAIILP